MSALPWIVHGERATAKDHPSLADVSNRVLRALLSESGYNPDADPFPGLGPGPGVVNPQVFSGPTAGQKIEAAVTALAATGGVIDCRGFPPDVPIILDHNIVAGLAVYNNKPFTFLWGPHEVRIMVNQGLRSHHHHILHGTRFILKDDNGNRVLGKIGFSVPYTAVGFGGPGNGVATTLGSGTIVKASPSAANWAYLEPGQTIGLFAYVPRLGRDNTTLNGGIDSSQTTITVGSTTGFQAAGRVRIENELITYTSLNGTQFLGCTRGADGSTAAAHSNGVAVDRAVYETFVIESVSGNNIVLAEGKTVNITATNLSAILGHVDIRFEGVGTFDGNKDPTTDDTNNPGGVHIELGKDCFVGPGITFQHWDHEGVMYRASTDCRVYSQFISCGRHAGGGGPLGAAVWFFGNCKNCYADVTGIDCNTVGVIDDRTNSPLDTDNASEGCTIHVRTMRRCRAGVHIEGSVRCTGVVESLIDTISGGNGGVISAAQWVTPGTPVDNVLDIGTSIGPGVLTDIAVGGGAEVGNNILICRRRGPVVTMPNGGGTVLQTPATMVSTSYGTTINIDSSRSEQFSISASDGVAFTIANPTNAASGRLLTLLISNNSGGTMGAITFGSEFRLSGAFTNPANGQLRFITFQKVGGLWREVSRTAADQSNT